MYHSVVKSNNDKENIVDPDLEKVDPTPSIYDLFRQFNERFFWDKLNMVEVSWSGRQMTTCAGVCSFHPRTGYCNIRLSAPLLSLRPRKDLVETLLHEMIHAYLFMTHNNKDRNDHGPEFHKHMNRINQAAGTNITVYHTFNDEVRHFKTHVWRCNGPCQKVGPFFGFVRRASNRAPGPNDRWWESHRNNCFGTFEKIEEPPGYKAKTKKGEKAGKKGSASDLRSFFPVVGNPSSGSNIHTLSEIGAGSGRAVGGGMLKNKGSGTVVVSGKASGAPTGRPGVTSTAAPSRVPPTGPNIHTFSDLSGSPEGVTKKTKVPPSAATISGKPPRSHLPISRTVGASKSTPHTKAGSSRNGRPQGTSVNDKVRNVWANKFPENPNPPTAKRKSEEPHTVDKRTVTECSQCGDLVCESTLAAHNENCHAKKLPCPVCGAPVKHGCLEQHLSECLSDDITEDIFGTEQVPEPNNQADVTQECQGSEQHVACPICGVNVLERKINSHIDECLNVQALREGL